jgi:apolipoprotein N-acyltransferase
VGTWRVPVIADGRQSAISGSLLYASNPPFVWFWPIAVLLACVLAARRLRRPELDARLARMLAIAALIAFAIGGVGRELHGHPAVSVDQLVILAIILAFVAWGCAARCSSPRAGSAIASSRWPRSGEVSLRCRPSPTDTC